MLDGEELKEAESLACAVECKEEDLTPLEVDCCITSPMAEPKTSRIGTKAFICIESILKLVI
jgi:hypothetical protein